MISLKTSVSKYLLNQEIPYLAILDFKLTIPDRRPSEHEKLSFLPFLYLKFAVLTIIVIKLYYYTIHQTISL